MFYLQKHKKVEILYFTILTMYGQCNSKVYYKFPKLVLGHTIIDLLRESEMYRSRSYTQNEATYGIWQHVHESYYYSIVWRQYIDSYWGIGDGAV